MILSGILVIIVIGLFALIALGVLDLVITIVAAVKSNNGEKFKYPLSLEILK
jgi:uncharacterized Tic20 family protein